MFAAGIFAIMNEPVKSTVRPPAGCHRVVVKISDLFERPTDDDPPTSVRKTKPTFRELRVMQNYFDECSDRTLLGAISRASTII